jgi:para-aminobenzoate synthetase component 1
VLDTPELLITCHAGVMHIVEAASGDVVAEHVGADPLEVLTQELAKFPAREEGGITFPVAVVAMTYEFGRTFAPHARAFPHHHRAKVPDFFAAIHTRSSFPEHVPAAGVSIAAHPLVPSISRDDYERRVEAIIDRIRAGDLYQANLAVPWHSGTHAVAWDVFASGLAQGGSDFAAYVSFFGGAHVSFSPELLLRRRGNQIETRPIKGTMRVDGDDPAEVARALLASPKDLAEHVMIVDLERNDLGRICESGSVRVDPLQEVVAMQDLVHIESTVRGTLKTGIGLRDIFAATFPGGSVTGAPKKAALELIGRMESGPRGIFCGAMGWIDAKGDMDLNLPIRTATIHDGGAVEIHVGGGIVADSEPAAEWDEIETKLSFFRRVLTGDTRRMG